jgi:hypothetical protein
MLVQPMEKTEGGLSQVEERAIHDLCEYAGARKIFIYEKSDNLTDNQIKKLLN